MGKRIAAVLALVLLGLLPALGAAAAVMPDLEPYLNVACTQEMKDYAYSADYVCDVWVFPRNARTEEKCSRWLKACAAEGFELSESLVEGYRAYIIAGESGDYAMLLPDYSGCVMLMAPASMPYEPTYKEPEDKPTARPQRTPKPEFVPGGGGGGHWEPVLVTVDCPSCVGGRCKVCDGSGVYRLYGQRVACDPACAACDGRGSYQTTQMVWVYD